MTLTKAEARTLREAIGATPEQVAERAGLTVNDIRFAENERYQVMPSVQHTRALQELRSVYESAVQRVVNDARAAGVIIRSRWHSKRRGTPSEFDRMVPELAGWPERVQPIFWGDVHDQTRLPIQYVEEQP